MPDRDALLEEYISRYKVGLVPSDKKLFAIGFIGVTGVGKSYVAQALAHKTGLLISRNDSVRRFLNEKGIDQVESGEPNFPIMQYIAENVSVFLYEHKLSHVLDQDMIKFYDKAINIAKEHNADFLLVKLTCPEEVILKRLTDRKLEIDKNVSPNDSIAGIEEYEKRKILHETTKIPEDLIFFTIATNEDIDSQVSALVSKLKQANYL